MLASFPYPLLSLVLCVVFFLFPLEVSFSHHISFRPASGLSMGDLKLCRPILLGHFAYEAYRGTRIPLGVQSLTAGMYLQATPKKTLGSTELSCLV